MIWLVLGMTAAIVLSAVVIGIVALPALRDGRSLLTERGERFFHVASESTAQVARVGRRSRAGKGESAQTASTK